MKSLLPIFVLVASFASFAPAAEPKIIGRESLLKLDERMLHTEIVNCAPADNALADVNPPRFRWYYVPDPTVLTGETRVLYTFRLQIADEPSFAAPLVDVPTELNFYNELAPLPEDKPLYWRVGYLCQMACWDGRGVAVPREKSPGKWSAVRRFSIPPGTTKWDRSMLRSPQFGRHPRLLMGPQTLDRLRTLAADGEWGKIFEKDIVKPARQAAAMPQWQNWPAADTGEEVKGYYGAGRNLLRAAMAYKLTGRGEFRNAVNIFARIATYPRGGRSSPEGMGGDEVEDSTSLTEFLALAYDWFYDEYTPEQRAAFEKSLEWRISAWMHEFRWGGAWYTPFHRGEYSGPAVSVACLQLQGGDHNWEGSLAVLPAAISLYDKSEVARRYFHTMANFLVGVGERAAQNGCPDQGLSYGHSHLKWLLFQLVYLQSALPELHVERHPLLAEAARFYMAAAPAGLPAAPWGRGDAHGYFIGQRSETFGLLARLCGDLDVWRCWQAAGQPRSYWWRPWVQMAAAAMFEEPRRARADGERTDFAFPCSGWVMSHTYPTYSLKSFTDGLGVTFVCRPSHRQNTFFSNNSFQLYACGELLNWGGGGSEDPLPFHTMSHNTVLVNGLGQADGGGDTFRAAAMGGLIAYKSHPLYTYWVGDATAWYPREPYRVATWKLVFDPNVYGRQAVPELRLFRRHMLLVRRQYLLIFDDLETDPNRPAIFTWLYRVRQKGPVLYDANEGRLAYLAGATPVLLQHVASPRLLQYTDFEGLGWLRNPITGEDFSTNKHTRREVLENPAAAHIIPAHNFWFTLSRKQSRHHFLVAICPAARGRKCPEVTRLDDWTVKVATAEATDVISFDKETRHPATIRVDLPAMRGPPPWKTAD